MFGTRRVVQVVREKRSLRALFLIVFAAGGVFADYRSCGAIETDLVYARPGDIPILIAAPHGGYHDAAGVPERQSGKRRRDAYTYELVGILSTELNRLLGVEPYVVMAEFHRKYVDANRPPEEAYESNNAGQYYETYHSVIRCFIREIRERWQAGVLIDVHGQAQDPDKIHRGTQDGTTVELLLNREGPAAMSGPESILGYLENMGYKVYPDGQTPFARQQEDSRYSGGFTVRAYGSHQENGIDAIQLEIGRNYRENPTVYAGFARDLAQAISVFYRSHLEESLASPIGYSAGATLRESGCTAGR